MIGIKGLKSNVSSIKRHYRMAKLSTTNLIEIKKIYIINHTLSESLLKIDTNKLHGVTLLTFSIFCYVKHSKDVSILVAN